MLADLLNFENCHSVDAIEKRFLEISKEIFENYLILNNENQRYFAITGLDLSIDYPEANSIDPTIHKHPKQYTAKDWYIHQYKTGNFKLPKHTMLSVTCGKTNSHYASIKIDCVVDVTNALDTKMNQKEFTDTQISKPAKSLQALLWNESQKMQDKKFTQDEILLLKQLTTQSIFQPNSKIVLIPYDVLSIYNFGFIIIQKERKRSNKPKRKLSEKELIEINTAGKYKYYTALKPQNSNSKKPRISKSSKSQPSSYEEKLAVLNIRNILGKK